MLKLYKKNYEYGFNPCFEEWGNHLELNQRVQCDVETCIDFKFKRKESQSFKVDSSCPEIYNCFENFYNSVANKYKENLKEGKKSEVAGIIDLEIQIMMFVCDKSPVSLSSSFVIRRIKNKEAFEFGINYTKGTDNVVTLTTDFGKYFMYRKCFENLYGSLHSLADKISESEKTELKPEKEKGKVRKKIREIIGSRDY